jgi:hypothetical protein
MPVRLVDIAAGHGRYVLDALVNNADHVEHLQLRDYSDINVTAGRQLIAQAACRTRHASIRATLSMLPISLHCNHAPRWPSSPACMNCFRQWRIRDSLAGLAAAVPPGGYLIYTNQPWHPQLEMIARTLTSHRGGTNWVMRRTQEEMDQLVAGWFRQNQPVYR